MKRRQRSGREYSYNQDEKERGDDGRWSKSTIGSEAPSKRTEEPGWSDGKGLTLLVVWNEDEQGFLADRSRDF
jgi:hypothetical protein